MVHAPAGGGSSSTMTTTSMRNSPANGTPGTSTPQGRMGRMGAMPPTNATMNGTVLKPLSSLKAQKLEMAAVERRGQPNMAREFSKPQRLFGLSEAPTFNPTEEQFKNPIEYIKSIADEGRRFGIVKIIPPDSWNPDLAIDTEVRYCSRQHFSCPLYISSCIAAKGPYDRSGNAY